MCIRDRPQVLLLDEPLAAVDPYLRKSLQMQLRKLHLRTKITFVMVTHDQNEAFALCGRVALLNHGKLVQMGTPTQLRKKPNSIFSAQFVGENNVIEGEVEKMGKEFWVLNTSWGKIKIKESEDNESSIMVGAKVALVIPVNEFSSQENLDNNIVTIQ